MRSKHGVFTDRIGDLSPNPTWRSGKTGLFPHPYNMECGDKSQAPFARIFLLRLFDKALDHTFYSGFFEINGELIAFYERYGSIAEFLMEYSLAKTVD